MFDFIYSCHFLKQFIYTPFIEPEPQVPVCEQPKEIGPCRATLLRWFYNPRTRDCEQFFYGGCQGNDNNFESQDECRQRCGVQRERRKTTLCCFIIFKHSKM